MESETIQKDDQPTRRQKRRMMIVCVFVFLAVYGLSAFPMAWLSKQIKFAPFDRGLEIFYAPLIVVVEFFFQIIG